MILILHGDSHVAIVWNLSQWSIYTCERNACNTGPKEEIPAEKETMATGPTFLIDKEIPNPPLGLRVTSFA
jgi:hypothetical protein